MFPIINSVNVMSSLCSAANYMDNWKCTGILRGDGSPVNGSAGQSVALSAVSPAGLQAQNSVVGAASAGR